MNANVQPEADAGSNSDPQDLTQDRSLADLLREMLRERDVPCPLCGYNLRNLTGQRCPECGNALSLQVNLVEPRLGPYITLLTACCLGFGGSALFTLVALGRAPSRWWHRGPGLVLIVQVLFTGVLLPFILTRRAGFRRASSRRQRAMALAMCVIVALLWAAFVFVFDER